MTLHKLQTKDGEEVMDLTPLKAIRQKCLQCSNWQPIEVKHCPVEACALTPYRFGTNPERKGVGGRNLNPALSREISEATDEI
jgi:hypothetical protein